jgi:hypothetical protein
VLGLAPASLLAPGISGVAAIEHRGIQYQIVQTASPTGWKWTVQLDGGRTKTGLSCSEQYAIFDAANAIEKALSAVPKEK